MGASFGNGRRDQPRKPLGGIVDGRKNGRQTSAKMGDDEQECKEHTRRQEMKNNGKIKR